MPPAESVHDRLSRWARVVVCGLAILVAAHVAILTLWLAPSSPIRDAVGNKTLAQYVDPYFTQGQDTLGIGSNRVDESLQIRARVRDTAKGKVRLTPWVDVTAIENTALKGSLAPARSHQAARRLATTMNYAVLQLGPEQRKLLEKVTAEQDGATVRKKLIVEGKRTRAAWNFQASDSMARRFTSLWLQASLGDVEIVEISYRVGRREVPDVAKRGEDTVTGRPFTWINLGWRAPYRGTPEARDAFTRYVGSLS